VVGAPDQVPFVTDNWLGTLVVPEIVGALVFFGATFKEVALWIAAGELTRLGAAFAGSIGVSTPNTNTLARTRAVSPNRFMVLRCMRHL
jgi:hypothetical protein